jgi:serine protease Do
MRSIRPKRIAGAIAALAAPIYLNLPSAHAASGDYAELVRRVSPSVVTVLVTEKREGAGQRAVERAAANSDRTGLNTILRRLLAGSESDPGQHDGEGALGSGFIIRADGLIVTNRHVVVDARSVQVKLPDGKQVPARVVGADAATDIALIKVTAGTLPALELGSSADLSVGNAVIAIGNPFGLGQTVTAGILSARGRALDIDPYIDFLQTDASINFGNSGGPLLSSDGIVVGVTSAIFSPSGGSVGLGFAIPAETVAAVVAELEAHGRVDRGYLGISAQTVTPAIGRALGVDPPQGALVTVVDPKGPSAGALQVGDVLLSLGSTPVTFEHLGRIAGRLRPGSTQTGVIRRDGTQLSVPLKIGQLPEPPADPALGDPDVWVPSLELGVARATMAIRMAIKASDETGGLIVTQLRREGAGALAGLKVGDLITHAGTKHLEQTADIASVSKPSAKIPLLLRVIRDGTPSFVAVTGGEEK